MMRASPCDRVTVHLVQHELSLPGTNPHATSLQSPEKQRLVAEWTRDGRYSDARVIRHAEQLAHYPSIPSRRMAMESAAAEAYDFHLWMEDDAFVFDPDWRVWPNAMNGNRVGAFRRNAFGYVNAAHYVSTPEHDALLLGELRRPELWNLYTSMYLVQNGEKVLNLHAPRIEPAITRLAAGRVGKLNARVAARHNPRNPAAAEELKDLLRGVCPDDLELLELDFPEVLWR
jgi:hypothetical protein